MLKNIAPAMINDAISLVRTALASATVSLSVSRSYWRDKRKRTNELVLRMFESNIERLGR